MVAAPARHLAVLSSVPDGAHLVGRPNSGSAPLFRTGLLQGQAERSAVVRDAV